jgi:hypothetical protein
MSMLEPCVQAAANLGPLAKWPNFVSWLDFLKKFADLIALVGTPAAAGWAVWNYRRSLKLKRATWMKDLYEKFYEQERLKEVRGVLDGDDERKISEMVLKEGSAFTDYLNFFEFLAYLDGKANSHEGNTRDV